MSLFLSELTKAVKFYVILITSAFLYLCYLYCLCKPLCLFWPSEWNEKSSFWKCSAVLQMDTKIIHHIIPNFKVTISISSVIIFLLYFILRKNNVYFVWIFKKCSGLFDHTLLRNYQFYNFLKYFYFKFFKYHNQFNSKLI